jgi:hypothetical protein
MSITITAPVVVVPLLREGADAVARGIAEAIDRDGDLVVCRGRLDGLCRLLGLLAEPGGEVELDVAQHAATLTPAVGHVLAVLESGLDELDQGDPCRVRVSVSTGSFNGSRARCRPRSRLSAGVSRVAWCWSCAGRFTHSWVGRASKPPC